MTAPVTADRTRRPWRVRLFEAFAQRAWEGSGLEITDLGGDRLDTSRMMLAGFGVYADTVALLLDSENDVERVTKQIRASGVVPHMLVKLCEPNLEEENFSAGELVALAAGIARASGVELRWLAVVGVEPQPRAPNRRGGALWRADLAAHRDALTRLRQRPV